MSPGGGAYRGPMTAAGHDHRRGGIPFWAHQLVELLLALVLLVEGARSGAGVEVLGAAIVLLLFALATDGPLGAWRGLSRRVHRVGDFTLAALLAVAPLAFGVTDAFTIALLLGTATCLCWLGVRGDFTARAGRAPWTRAGRHAPSEPSPSAAVTRPTSRDLGRALGRLRVAGPRVAGRTVGRAVAGSSPPVETTTTEPAPGAEDDGIPDPG